MMTKPNIQIDDEVREMTDEEYAVWLEQQANYVPLLGVASNGSPI